MSEPFIAEVRIFAGNFAPSGWALCEGQTLPIAQNTALFSILGTMYGGDGETVLQLPDLRGRVPIHQGTGAGLSSYQPGQRGGTVAETLGAAHVPVHNHGALAGNAMEASSDTATTHDPSGNFLAVTEGSNRRVYRDVGTVVDTGSPAGAATVQSHENRQPFLVLHFIIALIGLYPSP